MAQWQKELAAKSDDFSSIPRTYIVEGEKVTPASCSLCVCMHVHTHRGKEISKNMILRQCLSITKP